MGMMNIYDIQDAKSQEDLNYGKMMGNTQQGRTAVSVMGMMGSQLGSAAGSLLGGRTPQEQKMDKVQEIQAKFGEPETQEDLNNIIVAFKEAGMPDLATQLTKDFGDMLKIRGLINKPQLASQWAYQGRPNFMSNWLFDAYGLKVPSANLTIAKVSKIIREQAGTDKGLASQWRKDLKEDMKLAEETFKSTNALTNFGSTSTTKGLAMPAGSGFEPKDKATINGDTLGVPTGAGHEATTAVTQVDPEAAGFWRDKQQYYANQDILRSVSDALVTKVPVAFFGDTTLSVSEVKQDKLNQEVRAWADKAVRGNGYLIQNPDKVQAFINDPLAWYKKNIKKK